MILSAAEIGFALRDKLGHCQRLDLPVVAWLPPNNGRPVAAEEEIDLVEAKGHEMTDIVRQRAAVLPQKTSAVQLCLKTSVSQVKKFKRKQWRQGAHSLCVHNHSSTMASQCLLVWRGPRAKEADRTGRGFISLSSFECFWHDTRRSTITRETLMMAADG